MGLEKAIEHGKEHRKPYRGSKAFDHYCRNHGECIWCKNNRLFSKTKDREKLKEELKDYESDAETASL